MENLSLEISPSEVKAKLDAGEPVRLIDVREPEEFAICRIEGATLMPMRSIAQNINQLDDDGPTIVAICHHGVRSLSVVDWLRRNGVKTAGAWQAEWTFGAC